MLSFQSVLLPCSSARAAATQPPRGRGIGNARRPFLTTGGAADPGVGAGRPRAGGVWAGPLSGVQVAPHCGVPRGLSAESTLWCPFYKDAGPVRSGPHPTTSLPLGYSLRVPISAGSRSGSQDFNTRISGEHEHGVCHPFYSVLLYCIDYVSSRTTLRRSGE